jgi:hypothetical protein
MPLTNEEFARLDAARVNSMHHRQTGDNKRVLQLAFEHIEDMHRHVSKALNTANELVALHRRSLCYRIPAFFALNWARVKFWVTSWSR